MKNKHIIFSLCLLFISALSSASAVDLPEGGFYHRDHKNLDGLFFTPYSGLEDPNCFTNIVSNINFQAKVAIYGNVAGALVKGPEKGKAARYEIRLTFKDEPEVPSSFRFYCELKTETK